MLSPDPVDRKRLRPEGEILRATPDHWRHHLLAGALVAVLLCGWWVCAPPFAARAAGSAGVCPPASAAAPVAPMPTLGSTQPGPEEVLACIGAQPITGATYEHWLVIAEKSASKGSQPSSKELLSEAMSFLISADWVLGEAKALNIFVSSAEVHHDFDRIRRLQFPKPAEFTRFLAQSGQSIEDLLFRVKLNLSSQRIQNKVSASHHSAKSRKRALARFVRAFRLKWTARTYCDPRYIVRDCGHVQSAL